MWEATAEAAYSNIIDGGNRHGGDGNEYGILLFA